MITMLQRNAMNLNELDYVAGGTISETADDSFELYDRGLLKDHYNAAEMAVEWKTLSAKVDDAWRKAGIDVITKPFGGNVYKQNGKTLTRDEAMEHLKKNFTQVPLN